MKQSRDQIQTYQTLYKISMAIGTSLDLYKMLRGSVDTFVKALGCKAGGVYQCQPEKTGEHGFELVVTKPRKTAGNAAYQAAAATLPEASDAAEAVEFFQSLPLAGETEDGHFFHILELPDFGLMILVKNKEPIAPEMLELLRPLQEKLAKAALACQYGEEQRQAQERSQTILESVTIPLLISRVADGRIIFANELLADMIQVPLENLIGEDTPDFYADKADRKKLLTALSEQGALSNYELHLKRGDGELIWALISIRPFQFQDETALITTLIDVTERKQAAQELIESRARTQSILESVTLPLLISRMTDGKVLYANERVSSLIGMNVEDVIGKQTPNFYTNPDDRQLILSDLREHGGANNRELAINHTDGHQLWVLISNRLVQYDGETAIITTLIDITDRKLAEEALAKRAAELETVARVSASAATILETDHLLQEVVDLTTERFGLYHAHIYLLDKEGDTLILATGAGDIGQQMVAEKRTIPLAQEQSLVAQAARSKKGVIENDVRSNPAFLPHPLLPKTRSEMAVPMLVGERVVGVLDVQAEDVGHFTSQDIVVQTALAAQIGVAMENSRSFEQAQLALAEAEESRESVQEYLDRQRILHELNIELNKIEDLDGLYNRAIQLAHDRLGFERIGLYLLNESKDRLLGTYGFDKGNRFREERGPEFEIDSLPTIETYVTNRERLVVEEHTDLWDKQEVVGQGWHIGAAMWVEENPIGVIFADNAISGQPMKPYQPELLFSYASIVASLIERRRYEEIITQRAAELNELSRRLTRQGWEEYLRQQPAEKTGFVYDASELESVKTLSKAVVQNGKKQELQTGFVKPIQIRGEAIGNVVVVPDGADDEIDPEISEIIEVITEQLGARIDNLRLAEETQQALQETEEQAQRLAQLNQLSTALSQAVSISDIYQSAVEESPAVVPANRVSLALLAESGEHFDVVATWGEVTDMPVGTQLLAAGSPLQKAVQERRIIIGTTDDAIKLAMFVPLVVSGKAVGTLNIGRYEGEFNNQEENLMRQIAAMVGTTIENIRFLANEQSRAQREQMLRQITQRIRSSADMETIMRTAVQEIGRTLGRKTYIYLGDDREA